VLALYVMGYTLGRGWIEMLRIDTVQMNNVLGLRLNVWTSIVLFVLATTYFVWAGMRGVTREENVYAEGHGPEPEPTSDADTDSSAV
jgi:prolipoprotein diacylglyceryltransferase